MILKLLSGVEVVRQMEGNYKPNRHIVASIFRVTSLILGLLILLSYFEWFELIDHMPFHKQIEKILYRQLSISSQLEDGNTASDSDAPLPVGYVMNGTQASLRHRLAFAGQISRKKEMIKIWVPRRFGITEYDERLGRNLSDDEWTRRQLDALGIDGESYRLVKLPYGFFGTLSEIDGLLHLCKKLGYNRLAVISSDYHTRRIGITLKAFAGRQSIKWRVFGAPAPVSVRILLVEWCKYILYRYIVLPFN